MRFLDDTLSTMPTVNFVQQLAGNSTESSSSGVYTETDMVDVSMNTIEDDDGSTSRTEGTSDTDHPECTASSKSRLNSKKRKKQVQLQDAFLEMLKSTPRQERDVVDNFVEQLADILRRLPYPTRRNLQRNIMDMAINTEEAVEAEMQNTQK
ncbi:uncharacterized protein [Mycetomoellerius zeteki]|nr:PREDICTED: uncharacterized protein LOC108729517 [Trachymyrmex zeteki]